MWLRPCTTRPPSRWPALSCDTRLDNVRPSADERVLSRRQALVRSMTLLERVVPSLRDFRVPLIVGYAWTLILWLMFGGSLPSRSQALEDPNSVAGLFTRAWEEAGTAGRAAALSVFAYLLGSLVDDSVRTGFGAVVRKLPRRPIARVRGLIGKPFKRSKDDAQPPQRPRRSPTRQRRDPSLQIIRQVLSLDVRDYRRSVSDYLAQLSSPKPDEFRDRLWELFDIADQHAAEAMLRLHVGSIAVAAAYLALDAGLNGLMFSSAVFALLALWHAIAIGRRLRSATWEIGFALGDDYDYWLMHMEDLADHYR